MIITFSKNPVRQIIGIVFWNFSAFLFFGACSGLAYYLITVLKYDYLMLPPIPVSILGGALAIFLGFRNSSAYDRWWEARKIWGAIVNDSRSLGMELISYPTAKNPEEREEISDWRRRAFLRHIAWLYALNGHLRKIPTDLGEYLSEKDLNSIKGKKNLPAQIIVLQGIEIDYAYQKGWIDQFRFIALSETLKKFYDDQGKAERIKNTVFPFYYNYFTLFFLWLFTMSLPFALASLMNNWIMIPISVLISFAFFILNKSGRITETPFEDRAADTPTLTICRGIEIDMMEMLDSEKIPQPIEVAKGKFGVLYQK